MIEVACWAGWSYRFDPALQAAALAIMQGEEHLFGWIAGSDDLLTAIERPLG